MNGYETKDRTVALKTLIGEDKELMSQQDKPPELIKKATFDQKSTNLPEDYDPDNDYPVVCCYAGDSVKQFSTKFIPFVWNNWTGLCCIFGGFAVCVAFGSGNWDFFCIKINKLLFQILVILIWPRTLCLT